MRDRVSILTDGILTIDNTHADVSIITSLNVGSTFTNTAGRINVYMGTIGGDCIITAGIVTLANVTIKGNLTVANGCTIDFTSVTVLGNVTLGNVTTIVTRWKGGAYFGTLTDNGAHAFPAAAILMNK